MTFILCLASLVLAGAGIGIARRRVHVAPSAGGVPCASIFLLAFGVLWTAVVAGGLVTCGPPIGCLPALLCSAGSVLVFATWPLRARRAPVVLAARAALLVLGAGVCFFCLERPYNDALLSIDRTALWLEVKLLAAAALAVWLVTRRRLGAVVGLAAVCLLIGIANYFVCEFKGQTVLPADVLALRTAAAVASNYSYTLGSAPVVAIGVLLAYAALVLACPGPAPAPSGRPGRILVAAHAVAGLAVAAALIGWYEGRDIASEYGVRVDVWATRDSYVRYGTLPCFLQRLQEVSPQSPDGYSTDGAARLQAGLAQEWDLSHAGPAAAGAAAADEAPSVVVIMNESFSDLGIYPGVEGYDGLRLFWGIDAVERGWAYTSVRGGGTCNSEFEFLTGSTLGSVGGGVYPFMFYDLSGAESLPKYFSSLGYATHAIHPENPSNWRRDVVFPQLGFDDFTSGASFEGADALRGMTTDAETYAVILDLLADTSAPQFVFDVTLQNHGGYETGEIDQGAFADVRVNGEQIVGMGEYLACVDASEDDLVEFLAALDGLDRDVLVFFFGDHQPGFNDAAAEAGWGVPVSEESLEQVQQRFATPYMIWANYDLPVARGEGAADGAGGGRPALTEGSSLGYLQARLIEVAGLPLTEYQKALSELRQDMPAVNLNGYADAHWRWYWYSQDGPAADVRDAYRELQYANLFDAGGNAAFDAFVAGEI